MYQRGSTTKSYPIGNLLARTPVTTATLRRDALASTYVAEVQAVFDEYAPYMLEFQEEWWLLPSEAELPCVDKELERVMVNEMTPHMGHLAIHDDRPSALPCALTACNARLDGKGPYRGASLVVADGAVEIPYGESDVVLLWGRYAHFVRPPVSESSAKGHVVPRRASFVHYTKRGRASPPDVWATWRMQCAGESEGEAATVRRAALFGASAGHGAGSQTRSRVEAQ